jgi:hypothetical protein
VTLTHTLKEFRRASLWLVLFVLLALYLVFVAGTPAANLDVLAWKALLLTGAAYLGYWLDRNLFPGARPHVFESRGWDNADYLHKQQLMFERADRARLRRAIIVAAVVLAAALGV